MSAISTGLALHHGSSSAALSQVLVRLIDRGRVELELHRTDDRPHPGEVAGVLAFGHQGEGPLGHDDGVADRNRAPTSKTLAFQYAEARATVESRVSALAIALRQMRTA